MKCVEAWLYSWARDDRPLKGCVIQDDATVDAYFIPDGSPVSEGWIVSGDEGDVNEGGQMWFRWRASEETLSSAYRDSYENKIAELSSQIEWYRDKINNLG